MSWPMTLRNLLHYFRLLPDKRFLFGGRGGTDSSNGAAEGYRQQLTQTFRHLFPAWTQAEITHFWRGFVCLAYDRVPYIGPLDEAKTVWTALGLSRQWCGHGLMVRPRCCPHDAKQNGAK